MGFSAHIESPPGVSVYTNRFAKGQAIRVAGSLTSEFGGPLWGAGVNITIYGGNGLVSLQGSDSNDFLGHWYVDFVLPQVDSQAVITVSDNGGGGFGVYDPIIFNIAIGNALPEPPPSEGVQWWQWLLIGGGVILVAAVVLPKVLPQARKLLPLGRG